MSDIPERYVLLALRIGRHVDGVVDFYYGPPELRARVDAESLWEPRALNEEASALLDQLGDSGMEADRQRWLRGQLRGLEGITARLAGAEIAWSDEVERCLGVRPTFTDTAAFEAVHRRLDSILPGTGSLRARYNGWGEENAVPPDLLVPALERLRPMLKEGTRAFVELPEDESVSYEIVSGESWLAYNWYEGGHRSRVQVNADLPISVGMLADLGAHEAYPGHHVERCAKEVSLYEGRERLENSIAMVVAPEALISEGIAMNALPQALGPDPFDVIAETVADLGIKFDPAEAAAVHEAELELFASAVNLAFLLHERGATTEEAAAYAREWGLDSDERSARTVAFVADETWRGYIPAYMEGRRLCRAFIDREPGNFTRLLTEQLTTEDLLVQPG